MNYFVTAIHTNSGKTIVSAVFCEALKADYWKPIQAGQPYDSETIKKLLIGSPTVIHTEAYVLKIPASPHAAARLDNIEIKMERIVLPNTSRHLVIEGAGGCLVPLNNVNFVIDIALKFDCQVILVSNHYLGSINHTLLTYEALKKRNVPLAGIIFNGEQNVETERIVLQHTKLRCLLNIDREEHFTYETVKKYAAKLNENWKQGPI
jgi:dethiobiotin synthetase